LLIVPAVDTSDVAGIGAGAQAAREGLPIVAYRLL